MWDVIIVGGGPAGLGAAMTFNNEKVLLLEKMPNLGSKLLISGAGQCNVTHGGKMLNYGDHYGQHWRFARQALMAYTNEDLVKSLSSKGLECVELDNGKVFPKSLKAEDVLKAFVGLCPQTKIQTRAEVLNIEYDGHWLVTTDRETYKSRSVIIATGGMTYPKTGSTGDAYKFAKKLGVPVVNPHFGLAPLYIENYEMADLMGLSFSNIEISVFRQKRVGTYTGDLLLTHFGLSGPVILNNARDMVKGDEIHVNFIGMSSDEIEEHLLTSAKDHPKRSVRKCLENLKVPGRFLDKIVHDLNLNHNISELKKQDRKALMKALTDHTFKIAQVGKAHIAMVTCGGIDTKAISKKTYGVKTNKTLCFVGECVDVDGDTGGYNIQFAVSSGVAAARGLMEVLHEEV